MTTIALPDHDAMAPWRSLGREELLDEEWLLAEVETVPEVEVLASVSSLPVGATLTTLALVTVGAQTDARLVLGGNEGSSSDEGAGIASLRTASLSISVVAVDDD